MGNCAEALESRMLMALAPVGPDFRANTFLPNNQVYPAAAADADGDFVIAWESALQDGSGLGIYAQRYSSAGARRGPEFQVNTTTRFRQSGVAIAMDDAGDFVVAWQNHENDFESDIRARLYNAAGNPLTGEIFVNNVTAGDQGRASVAMSPAGDFVVAWDSFVQDGGAGDIFARRYNAAGSPLADEFRVNSVTANNQMYASVGMDSSGAFVIGWLNVVSPTNTSIAARRFDAGGVPRGDQFLVVTRPNDLGGNLVLAVGRSGEFALTWDQSALLPGGGVTSDVYARRYTAAGVAHGEPFLVHSTVAGTQYEPALAIDAANNLVVAWESSSDGSNDRDVYMRRFDAQNTPEGPEMRTNATTDGVQALAAVAVDGEGDVVVAWHGNPPGSTAFDVYARLFRESRPPRVGGVFLASSAWTPAFRAQLPGPAADAAAFGYSVPAGAQLDTLPWARLNQVSIRFTDEVSVASDDLTVRGANVAEYPVSAFAYSAATHTATWTLGRPLGRDKVRLDLDAGPAGVSGFGLALDGEWTGTASLPDAFPSGDGSPGGNFRFRVNILPGDVNRDRFVNTADLRQTLARRATRSYSVWHDISGNGVIDAADIAGVRLAMLSTLPREEPND